MNKLSVSILLIFICFLGNTYAQQRKNFIIVDCTVERSVYSFGSNFSAKERQYINQITDDFIGENIQVIKLEPVNTDYRASTEPNYKFNFFGFTFTLTYFPPAAQYKTFKGSEFFLSKMKWYKTEPQYYKSDFVLDIKEEHEVLGPIIIKLTAVLDTGS